MTNDALDLSIDSMDENPISRTVEHFRLDTSSENDTYELILRGYSKKPSADVWEKIKGDPNRYGMPDVAVNAIIGWRRSMVNKTLLQGSMSGIGKWKIFEDAVECSMDDFDFMLLVSGEIWNLGIAECSILSRETEEYIRLSWSRTLDNKERERDKANETIRHTDDLTEPKKKGIFR